MKWFDNTAPTVVIIGAVNWLLIGIFRLDLIAWLFGNMSWLSRIVYHLGVFSTCLKKRKGLPDKRCPFLCIR